MEGKILVVFFAVQVVICVARSCNDCCDENSTENCCPKSCCYSCNVCSTSSCRSRCRTECQVTTSAPPVHFTEIVRSRFNDNEAVSRQTDTKNDFDNSVLSNVNTTINLNNTITNTNTIHVPINITSINTNSIRVSASDSGREYIRPDVITPTYAPQPITPCGVPPVPRQIPYYIIVLRQPQPQPQPRPVGCCTKQQPTGCCNIQPQCSFQGCYSQCSSYC